MVKILRYIIFIAGILLIAESGLRFIGFLIRLRGPDPSVTKDSSFTILCVGDSHTEGLGSDPEQDYPSQLAKILGAKDMKGQIYAVYNIGFGGQNTAQLSENFENYLKKYRPDVVILLSGSSNMDNYWGYSRYKRQGVVQFMMRNLRIVRFFNVFSTPFRDNILAVKKIRKQGNSSVPESQKEESYQIAREGYEYFFKGELSRSPAKSG